MKRIEALKDICEQHHIERRARRKQKELAGRTDGELRTVWQRAGIKGIRILTSQGVRAFHPHQESAIRPYKGVAAHVLVTLGDDEKTVRVTWRNQNTRKTKYEVWFVAPYRDLG